MQGRNPPWLLGAKTLWVNLLFESDRGIEGEHIHTHDPNNGDHNRYWESCAYCNSK